MYHSSHQLPKSETGSEGSALRLAFADCPVGPWTVVPADVLNYRPLDVDCVSIHSPDVYFDEEAELAYLFVHAHLCNGVDGKRIHAQPTFVLVSNDGLNWAPPSAALSPPIEANYYPGMVSKDLFYLRVFRWSGYYYSVGKSQEDGIGRLVVARSQTPFGPFINGPILARAVRHCSLEVVDGVLLVFFTLITDMPERVLLASVHLNDDWESWRLSPGPIILTPELPYETGSASLATSKAGSAGCTPVVQLRDPHFMKLALNSSMLSGVLFYSVKGEGGFAAAGLSIDVSEYLQTLRFKNHSNIDDLVLRASSLKLPSSSTSDQGSHRQALITGTGRSGTTYLCELFNIANVSISHDNDVDCGRFPGTQGAASWYHAFRKRKGWGANASFDHVVHLVRSPLEVIRSRAKRIAALGQTEWMIKVVEDHEESSLLNEYSEKTLFQWCLRHWVRRNSFVAAHAEYTAKIEDVSSDPLNAWSLCLAAHGADSCPELSAWQEAIDHLSTHSNSGSSLPNPHNFSFSLSWDDLAAYGAEDRDYASIALKLGEALGYEPSSELANSFGLVSLKYKCGFDNEEEARADITVMPGLWDCLVLK